MEVRGASEKLQGGMCSGTGRGWCRAARSYLVAASPLIDQAECTWVNHGAALCPPELRLRRLMVAAFKPVKATRADLHVYDHVRSTWGAVPWTEVNERGWQVVLPVGR